MAVIAASGPRAPAQVRSPCASRRSKTCDIRNLLALSRDRRWGGLLLRLTRAAESRQSRAQRAKSRRRRLYGRRPARTLKAASPPHRRRDSSSRSHTKSGRKIASLLPANSPTAAQASCNPSLSPASRHLLVRPTAGTSRSSPYALLQPGTPSLRPIPECAPAFPLASETSALPWFLTTRASSRSVRVVRNPESKTEETGAPHKPAWLSGNADTRTTPCYWQRC